VKGAMCDVDRRLSENLACLRERISAAAEASGRSAGAVTLVAATKYLPAEVARKNRSGRLPRSGRKPPARAVVESVGIGRSAGGLALYRPFAA